MYLSLLLFLPPLAEFFGLRLFVARVIGLHPGYALITDYDFVPPSIAAFLFLTYLMEKKQRIRVRLNPMGLIVNLALMSVFLYLSYHFKGRETLWYFFAVCTILSALFILIHPKDVFFHPESYLIPLAVVAGLSKMIGRIVFAEAWEPVAKLTAQISCFTLKPLLPGLSCEFDVIDRMTTFHQIHHPLFTIAIGVGCSGLEGVFFFIFTAMLVLMANGKEWGGIKSLMFVAFGIVGIYALNIVRIGFFYSVAIGVHAMGAAADSIQVFLALFHSSVGWVLYTLYFSAYFLMWQKYACRTRMPYPVWTTAKT